MKRFPSLLKLSCNHPRTTASLVGIVLVVALALWWRVGYGDRNQRPSAERSEITVGMALAGLRPISETVDGLGTCESPVNKCALLCAVIDGRVREILVNHGDRVRAGQAVIQLDSKLAEMDLQRKLSQLEGLNSFRRQPQRLPRLEAGEEADAALQAAETAVALARTRLELHTIRSPIDGVIDRIDCKLGQTLAINAGPIVAVGLPVGEVVDARQLEVVLSLPALDAARVRTGQAATVTLCEVPRVRKWKLRKHEPAEPAAPAASGKVIFVGQVVDPQTGNLPARILIDNPEGRFALGATVAAAITVREKGQALVVPAGAIDEGGDYPRLRVVRNRMSFVLWPRLGLKNKAWVEVEGTNLQPGEPIIAEGGYNLPDGTRVRAESVANLAQDSDEEEEERGEL